MLSTQIAVCGLVLFVRRSRAVLLLERQYVRVSAVGIVWWHQLLGLSKGSARLTRTFVARHGTTQRALLRSSRGCCHWLFWGRSKMVGCSCSWCSTWKWEYITEQDVRVFVGFAALLVVLGCCQGLQAAAVVW